MLNFDERVKNSDAAQPRVTNVKTPHVKSPEDTQYPLTTSHDEPSHATAKTA